MKVYISFLLIFLSFSLSAQFDTFFKEGSLRLDYYHGGNATQEMYSLDQILAEPYWGGSTVNLIDTMNYGSYFVKIFDNESDSLIYSRGFNTLFGEWQTTNEAKKTSKSFSESVLFPMPKNDVRVELLSRDKKGVFQKKFEHVVDIDSYFIRTERHLEYPYFDVVNHGDCSEKVDIVIIPEGYSPEQMGLFISDCQKFANDIISFEPWTSNKDKLNIRAILSPSEESGTDIPGENIWRKTILNSSFYTFDSERYLMTLDNKSVRNLAANAPYDQIYILVNTTKYGGGGIYNFYSTSVNSNEQSAKIIVHEFGHAFAGLADEYYNNSTSFNDFYQMDVEPWEPNITTLVNFDKKWKHLLRKKTQIPTPEDGKWAKKDRLGVYEGGGYSAKGIYRPSIDCLMHTFDGEVFCDACKDAIQNMINFQCGITSEKK